MGPGRLPRQSRAVEGVIWLPEKWPSIAKRRLYFGVGSRGGIGRAFDKASSARPSGRRVYRLAAPDLFEYQRDSRQPILRCRRYLGLIDPSRT